MPAKNPSASDEQAQQPDASGAMSAAVSADASATPVAPMPAWLATTRDLIKLLAEELTDGIELHILKEDAEDTLVCISGPSAAVARGVSAHLLYTAPGVRNPTGMDWEYAGSGPDVERRRYNVYLRVRPAAPPPPPAPIIPL